MTTPPEPIKRIDQSRPEARWFDMSPPTLGIEWYSDMKTVNILTGIGTRFPTSLTLDDLLLVRILEAKGYTVTPPITKDPDPASVAPSPTVPCQPPEEKPRVTGYKHKGNGLACITFSNGFFSEKFPYQQCLEFCLEEGCTNPIVLDADGKRLP